MKEFGALRAKINPYLMDDNSEVNKSKGTKECVIKRELMFENYKDCLSNDKIVLESQQRFQSDHHKVYTEEINKIALSSNDIRDSKHLIGLKHIHMEKMFLKYVKVKG